MTLCYRHRAHHQGQGIVEYAGMIVLGAIFAISLISSAGQVMPAVFDLLLVNNEAAFTEGAPDMQP